MSPWQRQTGLSRGTTGLGGLTISPPALLSITVIACLILGVLHKRLAADGRSNPLISGVSTVTYPFQWSISRVEANLWFTWDWLFSARALSQENTRLQAENAALRLEIESLQKRADEADRLEKALKFARTQQKPPLVAPVIGWLPSPHFETITLGLGSQSGIKIGSIVRTASGLVGQVYEVTPFSAQVMLLSDTDSRAHVLLYRNGKLAGPVGVVQGRGRGQNLEAVYFKLEDKVLPGDVLKTSGYGSIFPPDVPVGTVTDVIEDKARSLRRARVESFAPLPGTLREVLVIR